MKNVDLKLDMQKVFDIMKNKTNRDYREYFDRNLEIFIARFAYNVKRSELAKEYNLTACRIHGIEAQMFRKFKEAAKKVNLG